MIVLAASPVLKNVYPGRVGDYISECFRANRQDCVRPLERNVPAMTMKKQVNAGWRSGSR